MRQQQELFSVNGALTLRVERLRAINSTLMALMPIYVLSGEPDLLFRLQGQYKDFDEVVGQIYDLETDPESRKALDYIKELSLKLRTLAVPGIALRKRGVPVAQVNEYFKQHTEKYSQALLVAIGELAEREATSLEIAKQRVAKTVSWVIAIMVVLTVLVFLLLAFISFLTTKLVKQKRAYDLAQENLLKQERKMSQARKETVEVVSHDLKNPLGTIKMSLEMMLDELGEGPLSELDFKEGLKIAQRSTETMEILIRDLLDHAKIEAGQLTLEKKQCNISLLVQDLSERYSLLAQNKNISFMTKISNANLFAVCDPGRTEQVLSNLLGNAIKFTPHHGKVKFSVSSKGGDIFFIVEDSGRGISKEQLPHIFDRFWQVKETAKEGNGLGLAIAKAIIDAHKGNIWAESEKGKGSKFCFRLPQSMTKSRDVNTSPL